jgi:glutamate dehydrogenase/leucine dehydrogenase
MIELLKTADDIGPERILHVYDPASGMKGVTVIDTTVFGRAGGGTRMLPDITTEEIFGLARAMTYKFAILDIPTGGAKSGIWGDPGIRGEKREAVMKAFGNAIAPLMRAGLGVGDDMGTNAHDVTLIYEGAGFSSRSPGLSQQEWEGEPMENHATGYGVGVAAAAACESAGIDLKGTRVAIEGFGKAAGGVARYLLDEGANIVAISTINGTTYNEKGLDVRKILEDRKNSGDGAVDNYQDARHIDRGELYFLPVDILIPGARPYVITGENASRVQARIISSIANIPITDDAEEMLFRKGVYSVPDFICNAGGVVLALVESVGGTPEDVFKALRNVLGKLTREVLTDARQEGTNPRSLAMKRTKGKVLKARTEKPPKLSPDERRQLYRERLGI